MERLIFVILRYIVCPKMDSFASSSFLSHLATSPSFYLRSCSLFQTFLRCCQERFVRLLVLCGTHRSFILRIKNHGGNSTADWVRQFSTVKIGCPVILNL